MKSAENLRGCLPWKLIYFIFPEKSKQLSYGFKPDCIIFRLKKIPLEFSTKKLKPMISAENWEKSTLESFRVCNICDICVKNKNNFLIALKIDLIFKAQQIHTKFPT